MTVCYPDVALIGRAGAGKTTAAELLVKHFGYQRLSFAAPLKIMAGTTTDRELLQRMGVGVRDLHADAWVNLLRHDIDQRNAANRDPFVIDDCRFPNEADMLELLGFTFIRVDAGRNQRVARLQANGKLQDEAQLEHVTETSLDHWETHATLHNTGSPVELLRDLTQILNRLGW